MPLDRDGVMCPGLKLLRTATAAKPTFQCGNCNHMRYSRCGCRLAGGKLKRVKVVQGA